MTFKKNDAVFPWMQQDGDQKLDIVETGLTVRQYFAAMAMQGILANPSSDVSPYELVAASAVVAADKLIEELNK